MSTPLSPIENRRGAAIRTHVEPERTSISDLSAPTAFSRSPSPKKLRPASSNSPPIMTLAPRWSTRMISVPLSTQTTETEEKTQEISLEVLMGSIDLYNKMISDLSSNPIWKNEQAGIKDWYVLFQAFDRCTRFKKIIIEPFQKDNTTFRALSINAEIRLASIIQDAQLYCFEQFGMTPGLDGTLPEFL